jgi:hypothetical protein
MMILIRNILSIGYNYGIPLWLTKAVFRIPWLPSRRLLLERDFDGLMLRLIERMLRRVLVSFIRLLKVYKG